MLCEQLASSSMTLSGLTNGCHLSFTWFCSLLTKTNRQFRGLGNFFWISWLRCDPKSVQNLTFLQCSHFLRINFKFFGFHYLKNNKNYKKYRLEKVMFSIDLRKMSFTLWNMWQQILKFIFQLHSDLSMEPQYSLWRHQDCGWNILMWLSCSMI